MKVFFKTFGCRTNIFDTQVMIENLQSHFLVNNEDEADIIVINSCTVTNGADRDVRDYISKVQKLNKKIFFTGCALDSVGKVAFDNKKIFGAFGHSSKENIESLLKIQNRFFIENDLSHKDSTIVSDFSSIPREAAEKIVDTFNDNKLDKDKYVILQVPAESDRAGGSYDYVLMPEDQVSYEVMQKNAQNEGL